MKLKEFFNKALPISYNLWKEDQDKIFNQLKTPSLKRDWLSTQYSIYSSSGIPIVIFLLTMFLIFYIEFVKSSISLGVKITIIILYPILFLYLFFFIIFNIKNYDEYIDEKYLEMSKNFKIKKTNN